MAVFIKDTLGLCRIIWSLLVVSGCIDCVQAQVTGVTITVTPDTAKVGAHEIYRFATGVTNAVITCGIDGSAQHTLEYKLKRDGTDVQFTTSPAYDITDPFDAATHAGKYKCFVTDGSLATQESPEVTVTLACPNGGECGSGDKFACDSTTESGEPFCACKYNGVFNSHCDACKREADGDTGHDKGCTAVKQQCMDDGTGCEKSAFDPDSVKITGPNGKIVGSGPIYKFTKDELDQKLTCAATGATHYRIYKVGITPKPDYVAWGADTKKTIKVDKAALGKYVCEAKDGGVEKVSDPITVTWDCDGSHSGDCADSSHAECNSDDKYCSCVYGGVFGATSCHVCKKEAAAGKAWDKGCDAEKPQCKADGSACQEKSAAGTTGASDGTTPSKDNTNTSSAGTVTSTACLVIASVVVALMN